MARLTRESEQRARDLIGLYPHSRSALIPILHVLQEQDGHLTEDGMAHVGELLDLAPAEVRGTASFYDMFHFEPVGRYLIAVCTNITCMLMGAYELLEHAEETLGVAAGGTTLDGVFTLEDAECLALCGNAPCLTVNWRFFGDVGTDDFDELVTNLAGGRYSDEIPPHGTLSRVRRTVGLAAGGRGVHGGGGPDPAPPEATAPSNPAPSVNGGVDLQTHVTTPAAAALDGPDAVPPRPEPS